MIRRYTRAVTPGTSARQTVEARKALALPVLVLAGAAASERLLAHHGYSLNYETDETGTVEGVVEDVFWSNPHVQYYLSVTSEGGSTRTWIVETHNLRILEDEGWTRDMVQIGDSIRVTGYLGRNDRPRIAGMEFELEDGTVHSLSGGADGESDE